MDILWKAEGSDPAETDVVQRVATVESVDNHIYFYLEVDTDRSLALTKQLRSLEAKIQSESVSRMLPPETRPPIWLHIQSPGGSLFSAFSIADTIAKLSVPVYSLVEGYAASAATILSTACTKRYIQPSAFVLIHQLSGGFWGKYEDIKDEQKALDMAMERLVAHYSRYTKMDEKKVRSVLKRESWFSAEECLEFGIADEIA